ATLSAGGSSDPSGRVLDPVRPEVVQPPCRSLSDTRKRKYLERRTRTVRGAGRPTRNGGHMQVRLALFVSALLAVFSLGAAAAFASGDEAVLNTSPFRLNPHTLEPSCFRADYVSDVDSHLIFDEGVTEEGHVTVRDGASVSIDQLLVPGS